MDKLSNLISSRFFDDISSIIATGQHQAYAAAGQAAIATYWNIGRRIVEEEQQGEVRAKYGSKLISELAQRLSTIYGNNYNKRNLQHYRKFYLLFPDFEKVYEFVHNLTWTHSTSASFCHQRSCTKVVSRKCLERHVEYGHP